MPKTKARSVRVPDDLWQAALARAGEREETVTDVILRALRNYEARAALSAVERRLFTDTDGEWLDDDVTLPVGELRRLLRDSGHDLSG